MTDNLQDIKEMLQEEKKEEKTEKDLYNNLVKYLYNIFDNEIREDLLERGFSYFSYNSTRQEICNDLAESQQEYNYYFMNYTKALKQVKSFFAEDIERIKAEQEQTKKQETKKERKKIKIFGVDLIIVIIFLPIILFFQVLDHTK